MMRLSPEKYSEKLGKVIGEQGLNNDQVDESSHFILRLCYCQSEELRRWFLQHESFLFQYRLKSMESTTMARAVRAYCRVKPISEEEKEQHRDALMQFMVNPSEFTLSKFYAVPFTQVLDLVAQRQCYLYRGQAFIPHARVESLLVSRFRADLSRTLASMGAHHVLSTDTAAADPEAGRLIPLVTNLNRCMVAEEPSASDVALAGTTLTAGNVLQHVPYMPLCMRQLQTGLQKDKKLKHWGRLQYGLFLKVSVWVCFGVVWVKTKSRTQQPTFRSFLRFTGRGFVHGRCLGLFPTTIFQHDWRTIHQGIRLQYSTHVRTGG